MLTRERAWLVTHYRIVLVFVFLTGAALRLVGLNNGSPPGLEHDEVAHWLINQEILNGSHGIYFPEAYGHEAGYHYFQSLFNWLLGANALSLRLPSAFLGLLVVAVSFALLRRLFGLPTAVLSAALLAMLFWPVFYSRLGLRAISLPFLSGLSAYFWWRGWQSQAGHPQISTDSGQISTVAGLISAPRGWYIAAGAAAGASLYTYMAARALPIFYILYAGYLFVLYRERFRRHFSHIVLFFLVMALVAGPIAAYLLTNAGVEARISEVDRPLAAFLAGDPGPAAANTLRILGMFGFRGDPLWRQNVAFLTVFEPLTAALFYIGLAISLWRWREPRYLFLILWLSTSAIPSIVTIDAPSSIRIINALPVLTAFPVIGLQVIHCLGCLSTVLARLSPIAGRTLAVIGLAGLALLNVGRTAQATFVTWPQSEEVQFVWQAALTDAAAYLDARSDAGPVAVGGWTPETMDPPTMALTLRRRDLSPRYFFPDDTLIIPAAEVGRPSLIVHPSILPLHPALEAQLMAWGASRQAGDSFTLYELANPVAPAPKRPVGATFGGELRLLGYDVLSACRAGEAEPCRLMTYWQVLAPAAGPRRVFLHLEDSSGILAQDDRLSAPAKFWQPGDLLLQPLELAVPSDAAQASLVIGVYDPVTFSRLPTASGADRVRLATMPLE